MFNRYALRHCLPILISGCIVVRAPAQTAYFADGYHGGVYGHYPTNFTRFMVDALRAHPDWKINLEIEPETWDSVSTNTPEALPIPSDFFTPT